MKSITFSKNSWHYRLVSFIKPPYQISDDFCGYFWDVIISAFSLVCMISALVFFTLLLLIHPLLYLAVSLQYGFFDLPAPVGVGLFLDIGSILIILFFYIIDIWYPAYQEKKYWNNFSKMTELPKPSFIMMSWNKFKDKTCFKVEFK